MNNKLFVGNLSYDLTEDQLKEAFEQIGPVVSVAIISDKFTGRSKGYGFVEMENEEAANEAVKTLDGSELGGRPMHVNIARPREDRGPRE